MPTDRDTDPGPDPRWVLALLFGLSSIPWTYGFVAGLEIPLWPSFIASAAFFAAGADARALLRALASTGAGALYAAGTLAVVDGALGGGPLALSVVVGLAMLAASLHAYVPGLEFTPGGFMGYATMFSVHAAEATGLGFSGLGGETVLTLLSLAIGAGIGATVQWSTEQLSGPARPVEGADPR